MRKIHHIKSWPDYYSASWHGLKEWELRVNDRGYKLGDYVCLHKYDPDKKEYMNPPDECLVKEITYIAEGNVIPKPFCIMSLRDITIADMQGQDITFTRKDDRPTYRCPQCGTLHPIGEKPEHCLTVELLMKALVSGEEFSEGDQARVVSLASQGFSEPSPQLLDPDDDEKTDGGLAPFSGGPEEP